MRNVDRVLWALLILTVFEWRTVLAQESENSSPEAGPQSRGLRKRLCRRYGICQGFGGQHGGYGGQFGNQGFGGYGGYPGQYPINIGISQSQSAAGGGGYGGFYPNYNQYNQGYHNQGYGGYPGPFYNGYQRPGYNSYPGYGPNNFNGNFYNPQVPYTFGYNQFNQGPFYDENNSNGAGYNGNRIENTDDSSNQNSEGQNSASVFSFAGRKRA